MMSRNRCVSLACIVASLCLVMVATSQQAAPYSGPQAQAAQQSPNSPQGARFFCESTRNA